MRNPTSECLWRRVLVYGMGASGQAAARLLLALGAGVLAVDSKGAHEIALDGLPAEGDFEMHRGRRPRGASGGRGRGGGLPRRAPRRAAPVGGPGAGPADPGRGGAGLRLPRRPGGGDHRLERQEHDHRPRRRHPEGGRLPGLRVRQLRPAAVGRGRRRRPGRRQARAAPLRGRRPPAGLRRRALLVPARDHRPLPPPGRHLPQPRPGPPGPPRRPPGLHRRQAPDLREPGRGRRGGAERRRPGEPGDAGARAGGASSPWKGRSRTAAGWTASG